MNGQTIANPALQRVKAIFWLSGETWDAGNYIGMWISHQSNRKTLIRRLCDGGQVVDCVVWSSLIVGVQGE